MKTFSNKILKESEMTDVQTPGVVTPGNLNNGVMNHYIPIQNIVINVRNIFGPWWGLVVEPGEDNQTLKIYNSQFTSEEAIWKILSYAPDGRTSLMDYVAAQGLPHVRMVNLGSVYVVYFYATDIAGQEDPETFATTGDNLPAATTCDKCCTDDIANTAAQECEISDLSNFITESDDEQQPLFYSGEIDLEDPLYKTIREVVDMNDKVRACGQWIKLLGDHVTLPDGYYWKAVKDRDGMESIALRKRFVKRRAFGKEMECVKSLMNIYNSAKDGIWVDAFEKDNTLPKEEQELLDNVLSFIQAQPSEDPCVFGVKQPMDDAANESLSASDMDKLFVVYDEFGEMLKGFNTKEEADKFAKDWSAEYHVNCNIEQQKI